MSYDKEIYQQAFNSWLKAKIPEGKYSKAAVVIFRDYDDPKKAFRRRRNEGARWKITDLCGLAEYLKMDVPTMFNQIDGAYHVLKAQIEK